MSTPVRGPDGPLGYAPRWARAGTDRADMDQINVDRTDADRTDAGLDGKGADATPLQRLAEDLKPLRVGAPRREPRDTVFDRDALFSRDALPGRDAFYDPDATSARDLRSAQDLVFTRDAPTRSILDEAEELGLISSRESAPRSDAKLPRTSETDQRFASRSPGKRKKRSNEFEGDTALRDLRARLAACPDQPPEPPLAPVRRPIFASVVRLTVVIVLAVVGALGFLWITSPHGARAPVASQANSGEVALVSLRGFEAPQRPAPQIAVNERAADATPPVADTPLAVANYTNDAIEKVTASPTGLTPRTPGPSRVPTSRVTAPPPVALAPAAVAPPAAPLPAAAPAPAPAVPAAVVAPAAPPPAAPAATAPDRDEVAALFMRARSYLSSGDVAAARLVLRRAAERDDPQAALTLGGTYDPTVLKRLGIISIHADPAQAREWYRKAAALGSADATLRLEHLVQTDH